MTQNEMKEYLAKIRKTVARSEAMIEQAERRVAATDRLLEEQGITREQLRNIRPTPEQVEAVNEELRRRGFEPLEPPPGAKDGYPELGRVAEPNFSPEFLTGAEELENRKRKFSTMMQSYRL